MYPNNFFTIVLNVDWLLSRSCSMWTGYFHDRAQCGLTTFTIVLNVDWLSFHFLIRFVLDTVLPNIIFFPILRPQFLVAGDDELDEDHVCDQHFVLRDLLCNWTREHPMDDHGRAIHTRDTPGGNVHSCPRQLALKFLSGNWIP